ncbi:hypothetical protein BDZ45DRAFT_808062 [Acephala macrosclerotiorum]|nr:hypothetical protein BDZ45DRAFT_808062 [Acephala macrosclerotiorum]
MAPRRGAAEVVAEEPELGRLTFNEPLSWRAGKPIPTGELLRRLDALSSELRDMDQEETDKDSLHKVAKELAGQNLLSHKDKGVRAFTACCLVDVLKICAPDAPFTPTQLKDIFTLFVTSILPALSDPSHAYNTQHKYVLVSLSEVKSIVLLCDIANSDSLILHLFSSFFDMISGSSKSSTGEQISKDVEYHMTQMLVTLVDEAASLPADVVDVIMAQFIRTTPFPTGKAKHDADEKQSTLLLKELPEAYNMAKTICNSCPEKMSRYVSQYFNEVILEVSGGVSKPNGHRRTSDGAADSDEDEAPTGPTESDLKELKKAHTLLRELWRASPAVLQNVIPQLDAELSAESVQLRCLATETLGDIISGIGAAGPPPSPHMDPAAYPPAKLEDYPQGPISASILTTPISPQSFAQTHPNVYQSFMGRKNDKSAVIRSSWTSAIGRILVTSAGGIGLSPHEETTLIKGLGEKLSDADEKVRLAAVKVVGEFGFRDIMSKLASNGSVNKQGSVLCSLTDRARDRRFAVRSEAMIIVCKIWGVASGEIAAGNESVVEALGTIPSKVLDAFYANDKETNVLLDHVMFEQLIPLGYPPAKGKAPKATNGESQSQLNGDGPFDADKIRTERILLLIKSLDQKSRKAFFALQSRQPTFSKVMDRFLKTCEDFNGGVTDSNAKEVKSKLDATIKWLADLLPDTFRASHDLQKYAKLHDRRSYQLLRFAMAPESDFSTVHKAIKEFQKRITSAPGGQSGLLDTLMPIIYRSSSLIYNRSHQPVILQYSRTDENGLGATAHIAMKEISDKYPEIFKASVKELCKSLEDQAPSETKANDPSSVDTLKALASFAKAENNQIPNDRKFTQTLLDFALYGTPPKAAKYAVSILVATTKRREMHMKDLLDKSLDGWVYGQSHFLTKLATISQLTLLDRKITEDRNDEIIDITTQQILLKYQTPKSDADPDWQHGQIDEECEAKCWAIKILVNHLRTIDDVDTAKRLAGPVYKLLNLLIIKAGELSKGNDALTPKHHKSRLRLLAAQQMLKLCTQKVFDDLLGPQEFIKLSFITQDPLEVVRRGFIEKLQKYIVKNRLSPRFNTIIFLTAFEPGSGGALRESIMTWIRSRAKIAHENKSPIFESILPRLIHLVAHHPDYSVEPEELKDIGTYILYYLNTVASEENLAHIYKCAQRVKQAKDAVPGADADNIYVLSDLTQALVKKYEEKRGWSMQTWPGQVGLPKNLYGALPSHEVAQEIAEKNYLPEEMDDCLDKLIRDADKKKKRKSDDKENSSHPAKKIKSEKSSRPTKTPAPKKERPVKEKKTPKPKKAKPADSTPAGSPVVRRQSGRGASAKKVYAEVDDDEADEEMMDGVAEWEYLDGSGDEASEAEAESAAEEVEEAAASEAEPEPEPTPEAEELEEEPEPEATAEEEAEEEEVEPTPPPATNGRRSARSSAKKPVVSPSKVTKSKPAPKGKAKATTKGKPPNAPLAKPKKGKRKAVSRAKDVFDMDESE